MLRVGPGRLPHVDYCCGRFGKCRRRWSLASRDRCALPCQRVPALSDHPGIEQSCLAGFRQRNNGIVTEAQIAPLPVYGNPLKPILGPGFRGTSLEMKMDVFHSNQAGNGRFCRGFTMLIWRRERDSNPRYPRGVYRFSRPAPSTTRPPLRIARGVPKHLWSNTIGEARQAALVDAHLLYQTSLSLHPGLRAVALSCVQMTFFRAAHIMQPHL